MKNVGEGINDSLGGDVSRLRYALEMRPGKMAMGGEGGSLARRKGRMGENDGWRNKKR